MMTLVLRFPGGRYHATPWGHHVNEGLVEWPPSPWRLLRAFLATGYSKLGWQPEPPETTRRLVERLSGVLPSYCLPRAPLAHTRHYMPDPKTKRLVFDTWAKVGNGDLAVLWDVALPDDEWALLSELVEKLGYLGRAEAWVEARLLPTGDPPRDGSNSFPCEGTACPDPGWEQVSLLAPLPAAEYARWRQESLEPLLSACPLPVGKKPPKKLLAQREEIEESYPKDLLACLQKDTAWMQKKGWSQPPGSRRVFYWRQTDALEVGPPQVVRHTKPKSVEAMLLALSTPSGNQSALPSVSRTLPQAELLHRALVSAADHAKPGGCPVLTGMDEHEVPLKGHQHAHLLPLDLDGDQHLEHILVWAPMGLDACAQEAVRAIRRTFTKGGVGDLHVSLTGLGSLEDMRHFPEPLREPLQRVLGIAKGSLTWVSQAPFVPPRFLKRTGKNSLVGQVTAELASRLQPAPADVEWIPWQEKGAKRFRHWVRRRDRGPQPPMDCGFSLRLRFSTPVTGPLCLGYGSHFGLGLFAAEPETETAC